ncbi:SMI1/KNR4 family protein [Hymenobacter cellulosivorans]|uniref:SMI1/KNR4 family protein n=1 Tax=Hymenobacter cellulosivorans TaxID=2932249 RepID=A0ABY4F8T0_9BACT|nr:SMI1/KNR4 family protein [Hymenobacter cellulosivorans]UOQ50876.1 SMI1/KNR4 family protein [Hymenobacter cellulosivorans]
MQQSLLHRISAFLAENELFWGTPARPEQLADAEVQLQLDPDYREFLALFGASYVGVPVYGFNACPMLPDTTVIQLTLEFRKAYAVDARWPILAQSCVLTTTGSGDPVILDPAGKVRVYYHDSHEEETLADSFADFIEQHLPTADTDF